MMKTFRSFYRSVAQQNHTAYYQPLNGILKYFLYMLQAQPHTYSFKLYVDHFNGLLYSRATLDTLSLYKMFFYAQDQSYTDS